MSFRERFTALKKILTSKTVNLIPDLCNIVIRYTIRPPYTLNRKDSYYCVLYDIYLLKDYYDDKNELLNILCEKYSINYNTILYIYNRSFMKINLHELEYLFTIDNKKIKRCFILKID